MMVRGQLVRIPTCPALTWSSWPSFKSSCPKCLYNSPHLSSQLTPPLNKWQKIIKLSESINMIEGGLGAEPPIPNIHCSVGASWLLRWGELTLKVGWVDFESGASWPKSGASWQWGELTRNWHDNQRAIESLESLTPSAVIFVGILLELFCFNRNLVRFCA